MTAPMNPADVPAETLNAFKTAGHAAMMTPGAAGDLSDRYLAGGLAAVIPAIRAAIRAQVADEIEAAAPEVTVLTSTQVIYQANGMRHAARIARGDQ